MVCPSTPKLCRLNGSSSRRLQAAARPIGWPALLSRDLVMDTSNGILQHSLPLDIAGTHLTMTAQYARPGAFTVFQITTKLRTKALIFLLP